MTLFIVAIVALVVVNALAVLVMARGRGRLAKTPQPRKVVSLRRVA